MELIWLGPILLIAAFLLLRIMAGFEFKPAKSLNYDDRWSDPKYIDMVHKTIRHEIEVFGTVITSCDAPCHLRNRSALKSGASTPNEHRSLMIG